MKNDFGLDLVSKDPLLWDIQRTIIHHISSCLKRGGWADLKYNGWEHECF